MLHKSAVCILTFPLRLFCPRVGSAITRQQLGSLQYPHQQQFQLPLPPRGKFVSNNPLSLPLRPVVNLGNWSPRDSGEHVNRGEGGTRRAAVIAAEYTTARNRSLPSREFTALGLRCLRFLPFASFMKAEQKQRSTPRTYVCTRSNSGAENLFPPLTHQQMNNWATPQQI